MTKCTLENKIKNRKPSRDLMLRTDVDKKYRWHVYQNVLKRHGIIHSLSRAEKFTGNTHMESLFCSMIINLSVSTGGRSAY